MGKKDRGAIVDLSSPVNAAMPERMSPLIHTAVLARTRLHRMGEPHEVVATALFLTSDDSSFFTGQGLSPNGSLFIG